MSRVLASIAILIGASQLSGCTVISAVATSERMESARAANAGKQLVPKDGKTYIIPVGAETVSYLGSGDTEYKLNNTSFVQPKGTYSIVEATPGAFAVYGNKHVVGGGEATSLLNVKERDAICFYVINPISAPARIETYTNDACDPILRSLKNQNVVGEIK